MLAARVALAVAGVRLMAQLAALGLRSLDWRVMAAPVARAMTQRLM